MPTARVAESVAPQSRFKVRDLLSLLSPQRSYLSPLAVIAHIDVNAFFAQVEQVRLSLSKDDPVVCVQWNSLIAVSYAARDYGIGRMDSLETARLKCPQLIPVHTAVFKKGENFWRYRDDDKDFPSPLDHKVSLDPYRRESRKIMKIFSKNCDLVEKASVDESFMDLGRNVLKALFELIPGLESQLETMDKLDLLPPVPKDLKLETQGVIIKSDKDTSEDEENQQLIHDWDDVLILIGSEITYKVRKEIESVLGYTTSCGVARVKTIAKLASGFKKPDNQTIIRNGAINNFLTSFEFTDFWSMGGKTGDYIKAKLSPPNADNIKFIRDNYDLRELEEFLEDKPLAEKLYLMVRGSYVAPLSERVVLKSMNSNKNIRANSGATFTDACQWIKVFAADLYQRLMETDDENGFQTRGKTISVKFRSMKNPDMHSKQSSLPHVPKEELEETLYRYGVNLLKMLATQYTVYPLINLNMTVSNFEQLRKSSSSIMAFMKKNDPSRQQQEFEEMASKDVKEATPDTSVDTAENHYTSLGDNIFKCHRCGTEVNDTAEHDDFHYAIAITEQLNGSGSLSLELQKFSTTKKSYGESRLSSRSNTQTKRGKISKQGKITKGQSRLPF